MRGVLVVVVLLLGGCYKPNDLYCEGLPDNDCRNLDGEQCASNEDCLGARAPICRTDSGPGVCVECVVNADCSGDTPVCSADNSCVGCRADDDCTSRACLETGACANEASVIYAKLGGVAAAGCGLRPGENECSFERALNEVNASRNIIRLAPGVYEPSDVTIVTPTTFVARGSTIRRLSLGPIIRVDSGQFKLVGGTLQSARNGSGILCSIASLEVHETIIEDSDRTAIQTDSCNLTVSRSILRRNLGGGIVMLNAPSVARITNNFVFRNGQFNTSTIGGMALRVTPDSAVEFNTVVDNVASLNAGAVGGIRCEGSYNAPNNIVYRNTGGPDGAVEVSGDCTFLQSFTLHGQADENVVGFRDPNHGISPDYHLTAGSSFDIRDVGPCTIKLDFDGDRRGLLDECDLGADEYIP